MAASPVFVSTPNVGRANNVANSSTTIFTAGSNGSRVDRILYQKTASTTTATLTFAVVNSATLYNFEVITSTNSTTEFGESSVVSPTKPLWLENGDTIEAVSSAAGDTFDIVVIGGDL